MDIRTPSRVSLVNIRQESWSTGERFSFLLPYIVSSKSAFGFCEFLLFRHLFSLREGEDRRQKRGTDGNKEGNYLMKTRR